MTNNQFKLLTNKKMKTLDRKKYTEDKGSSVSETTVGRSAKVALLGMLALWYWALSTQAQTKIQETKKDLIETVSDSSVAWKSYRDIWFFEAQDPIVKDEKDEPGVEPEPEDGEEEWKEPTKPEVKKESPTKFSIETGVWYSIWWEPYWCNRVLGVWTLFKGSKWETSVFTCYDFDDPLHSKWSWKLVTSTSLYKWTSLEWDYTFTWTWSNPARFGLGYWGKLSDGSYKVVAYPLNTNWSPISAKVSFGKKVWKDWRIDSFVFVDFWKKSYYSETEFTQKLAKWIALFLEARLWGTFDGKFNSEDSQNLLWGFKIDIK